MSIGVGLDHGHHAGIGGPALEGAYVVPDGFEVYLGPRAAGDTNSCDAALHFRLLAGVEDVQREDVHASDRTPQLIVLDDWQELEPAFGHDGCGL